MIKPFIEPLLIIITWFMYDLQKRLVDLIALMESLRIVTLEYVFDISCR